MVCVFFFFKQKTAYEMRISDWSSDVCSSDLAGAGRPRHALRPVGAESALKRLRQLDGLSRRARTAGQDDRGARQERRHHRGRQPRSEEHTSELQSLMRISYAVFCLKKKKT